MGTYYKPLESVVKSDALINAMQSAQKSTTFTTLQTKANLVNRTVTNDNSGTYTIDATGNINIDGRENVERTILGLTWEMTNSSNHTKLDDFSAKARKGTISRVDFIKGKLKVEAEAFVNQALVADDLNISDPMTASFSEGISKVKSGAMTKDQLLTSIAEWGYKNAVTKLPDGTSAKVADLYGQQYDKEHAKKNPE